MQSINGDFLVLVAETLKGDKYKAYWMGKANGHLMDWFGCNYKFVSIPGQPRLGFETSEEALEFGKAQPVDKDRLRVMEGTYIADRRVV